MDLPDPVVVMKGTLPPIAAALVFVGLFGARWLPAAVAVGLYVVFGLLKQWPLWPHQLWASPIGTQWLLWGVCAAALAAQLEHLRVLRGRVAVGAGVVVAAAAVWLMLGKLAQRWELADQLLFVGGGGLAVALLVLACRTIVARAPAGVGPAIVFTVMLSFDAVLLTIGRSGLLAQLCGAVAAALGTAAGTVLWRRPFVLAAGDGIWLGIAHGLFVLAGVHLGQLGWPSVLCALTAPLPLLALRGRLRDRPATWTLAALLLSLPPLAAAYAFAMQA